MKISLTDVNPLIGIALASGGYACFALQDALVKWLVTDYAVPEILFMRSIIIVMISGACAAYLRHPSIFRSRYRSTVGLRAALMLVAWLLFYNAAKHLGLAELTTLYFSAPIIVVVLSIFVLKEKVHKGRWIACIGGFLGVIVATNPVNSPNLVPAMMCVAAGCCWAWSTILARMVSRTETALTQMWSTSLLFAVACAVSFPWVWITPTLSDWGLMVALGLIATLGQYLLYEGFRHAPASALAPVEYTGLIWAFVYGYIIWADIPAGNVFVGAIMIVASSGFLVIWERRARAGAASPR
ncbi:DMT family transporter [Oryzifoliimicrobium ureilyticus]|uniref:DMT family transporter n=1 Tax=Oryzifoliimicrobium ureilyticus TaxID=3113724 RepID=UPI0030760F64